MKKNGAAKAAANLAHGANERTLAAMEKRVGVAFPKALRELYRLHDGQRQEQNGLLPSMKFLALEEAFEEREHFRAGSEGSKEWWVLGKMGADYIVVSLESGRVFLAANDATPMRAAGKDVAEFFEMLRRRIESGAADDEPRQTKDPEELIEDVFDATLGDNLFFLVDEIDVADDVINVTLALHASAAWQERLRAHRVIREPLARFEEALKKALPDHRCTVQLLAVEVDKSSMRVYLKRAGAIAADLLRELG
jgi:hypothetical protein